MPPVAFVKGHRLFVGQPFTGSVPGEQLQLGVVGHVHRLDTAPANWLQCCAHHLHLQAQAVQHVEVGPHRHRRLTTLDAVQRLMRHIGRIGDAASGYAQRLAPRAQLLAHGLQVALSEGIGRGHSLGGHPIFPTNADSEKNAGTVCGQVAQGDLVQGDLEPATFQALILSPLPRHRSPFTPG